MSLWMEHLNELQHYDDLLREAKEHRLAHQAQAGYQRKQKVFCSVMSWLGSRLSAWGSQLQEHYGTEPAATNFAKKYSG